MNTQNKIAQLFSFVSQNPKQALTKTFAFFAKKWTLSRDSVRNIYYQNYEKVLSDLPFCEKNNIEIENFKKFSPKNFTPQEEEWLLNEINSKLNQGFSLRKTCLDLAGGNVALMVRYLNKFRALSKKEKHEKFTRGPFTEKRKTEMFNLNSQPQKSNEITPNNAESNSRITKEINQNNSQNIANAKGQISAKSESKIIQMPEASDCLSEKDIQSLFLGLIRLVKNNTIKEMNFALNEKYKEKITEIYALKHNLGIVKNKLEEEKRMSAKLQIELNLLKNSRLEEYGEFMSKLNKSEFNETNKLN